MKYEVALNPETITAKYVKVKTRFGQLVITYRKTNVSKEIYDKLYKTQHNNFIFYENNIRKGVDKVFEPVEKTTLTGTIKKKNIVKKRKKGLKRILSRLL